eukprot:1162078-Pelagomonas_calceolata.AAC.9
MVTERHNIASRILLKGISKGPLGAGLAYMDISSTNRLAFQDIQIPERSTTYFEGIHGASALRILFSLIDVGSAYTACVATQTEVAVLLLEGHELVLEPGVFTAFGLGVAGAECSLFSPHPPLLLNGYQELVLGTLFIGTTIVRKV